MSILLTASCSACPHNQIEKKWQTIIESETVEEEQKNVIEFHKKCMKDITIYFEVKDNNGHIRTYDPTGDYLQQGVSVRLITSENCKTNFWQPKNIENFYFLFNE